LAIEISVLFLQPSFHCSFHGVSVGLPDISSVSGGEKLMEGHRFKIGVSVETAVK
jgi:hypothetical protein